VTSRARITAAAAAIALTAVCARPVAAAPVDASAAPERPGTAATTPLPAAPATHKLLTEYKARYNVSYRGISGGELEQALHPGTVDNQWVYESRAYPNLLGLIAISSDARQRSTMEVSAKGVRPLSLVFDDGRDFSHKDVNITFDWAAGRVRGTAKEKAFDFAVEPGTQDSASVQAAMIFDLLAGRDPGSFTILNGSKLEVYRYWPEGKETVETPAGKFDTVIWASQRDGSKRVNRVWHAPSLGYVPVQAIQFNRGRPDVQLKLVSFQQ
jgi:hypothetical protein